MGRLAVMLGSNAIGPGGETIAAAAAEHGAAIAAAPRQRRLRPPHGSTTRPTCAPLVEAGLRPGARDRLGRLAQGRARRSAAWSAPTTSSPCSSASRSSTTPAATAPRASTPSGASEVLAAWRASGGELRDGGVYWQTIGPRFETPAEIRLIAAHADLVGMTIASECIVAGELGLAYAAICVVDNLANGIGAGGAQRRPSSRRTARRNARAPRTTPWRRSCRGWARSGA